VVLTLREEHRLNLFERRVLRKKLWHEEDGVTREWRRLQNEELYDMSFLGIFRRSNQEE
jgi:hypothetical protein